MTKVRIPASTANLGPAYDAVGVAVQLYLTLEVKRLECGPSRLEVYGEDKHLIPEDDTNLVCRTILRVAAQQGVKVPFFQLRISNQIPIAKGLGSSSAAYLAGVVAADLLCDLKLGRERWLDITTAIEGHPDNAAPSLYGGLVASMSGERTVCACSKFPIQWTIIAVTPGFEVQTRAARAVLPPDIRRDHAVINVQHTAFLMTQLIHGRAEGLREAMTDFLHQPYRCDLIPGLREILDMDNRDGLIGVALSGAGPTVIAISDSHEQEIGADICDIFARHGLSAKVRLLKADNQGLVLED